ncbi:MAG TPA: glutamate-1-semialdehyde 2,1-aminomutase [Nitrososphaerales archaeon]|nr:glutamate-1-semialdehyde 2,1-aminomutase [Nitrososphaerales archaeon]
MQRKKKTTSKSERMFARAQKYFVGGVNSPVRSFRGVGMEYPLFIAKAKGSKIFDEDGNQYVDYVCSWGASILGSVYPSVIRAVKIAASRGLSYGAATNQESDLAERIQKSVPSMELMRFVSSGTEAAMSAVRVARAFTKRSKVVKFDGCYHGHADGFLVSGGSGLATFSVADSAGVPEQVASETLVAKYNDLESVQKIMEQNTGQVAAIIVEPVAGNMGVVPPQEGFLQGLRKFCDENGSLLIFDEVITGFRVARGGAQEVFGIKPDLTCLGKVIGGGMNIAAYGGRQDAMKLVSPLGPVYQAGTLSGNPVAVATGIATLDSLRPSVYAKLERTSKSLEAGLIRTARGAGVNIKLQRVASMIGLFFLKDDDDASLKDYSEIKDRCSKEAYSKFFSSMLGSGIYLPPSAFETIFVSASHTQSDVTRTLGAARLAFRKVVMV